MTRSTASSQDRSSKDSASQGSASAGSAPRNKASRLRFYLVVTVPAAALMAMEIVSSRLLAPHFGNSVYVWGSIIGVFLAVMSAGYWIGGRLADRHPHLRALAGVLLASSVCQAIVLVGGRRIVAFLGDLTGGEPAGVLLATAVLFGPATVFLAMVSPYAVKIATADLGSLGGTAGHLYALSTAGSLVGTLGATFVLIPRLPLEPILATILVATIASSLLAVGPEWRRQKLQITLAAGLLVLAVLPADLFRQSEINLLAERLSPYQTLKVNEASGVRTLYSDGILHSAIYVDSGRTHLQYPTVVPATFLLNPEIESLAVLGMGGGGLGIYMQTLRPSMMVDHVDVDQTVADLAQEFMGFEPGEHHRLTVMDGRRFLTSQPDRRWDLIFVDTYIGHSIPFHLTTREFYAEVRNHLNEGGILGLNSLRSIDSPLGLGLAKSISASFRQLYLFKVPGGGNTILLATNAADRKDQDELRAVARQLDPEFAAVEPTLSLAEIAEMYIPIELDLSRAEVLTDRYAPVNDLLRRSVDASSFGVQVTPEEPAQEETGEPDEEADEETNAGSD